MRKGGSGSWEHIKIKIIALGKEKGMDIGAGGDFPRLEVRWGLGTGSH